MGIANDLIFSLYNKNDDEDLIYGLNLKERLAFAFEGFGDNYEGMFTFLTSLTTHRAGDETFEKTLEEYLGESDEYSKLLEYLEHKHAMEMAERVKRDHQKLVEEGRRLTPSTLACIVNLMSDGEKKVFFGTLDRLQEIKRSANRETSPAR